jgi:hypothetical protein
MYDSENRLAGAKFFLDCAKHTDINQPQYKWYIQATASFAIAAIEILPYDYAEKNGLFPRSCKLRLENMKSKYPRDPFFAWLYHKLENDIPNDAKSIDGTRYAFLKEERNSILHRGERDKRKIEIRQPMGSGLSSVSIAFYFVGWDSEPCELVCENTIAFAEIIIGEAKTSGYI